MNIFPKIYTKTNFIEQLISNGINDNIIIKLNKLPEYVKSNNSIYSIYINVIQYGIENSTFNYEFNYYSNDLIEFLFNSKVFSDIELSVNNLLCDLMNAKLID
jgi:hypothetical protein